MGPIEFLEQGAAGDPEPADRPFLVELPQQLADRLEAAATRAIEIGSVTYGSVRSILDNKLDRQTAQRPPANGVPILHPNIRGPRYYH